jgi:hypothetical protein
MQLRAIGWWTLALTGLGACLYSMAVDPLSQWDFNVYYSAAHAFAAGGNPYTPVHPHPGLNGDVIFQYPPLTLYLFRWLTFFSLATSKLIWLGAKLGAVALLAWVWRRDFEATNFQWPILLFIALGLNTSLLRDFVCGNIATFEQVGLWFGFGLARLRGAVQVDAGGLFGATPADETARRLETIPRWRQHFFGLAHPESPLESRTDR